MIEGPMRLEVNLGGCGQAHVRNAARAIIYTILFHRCFGQVTPKTEEILDISVPIIDNQSLIDDVEQYATDYAMSKSRSEVHTYDQSKSNRTLRIEFMEKKVRKNWFSRTAEEDVCWEIWDIRISSSQRSASAMHGPQDVAPKDLDLKATLLNIVSLVNQRNDDYIPPIPYNDANPFTYHLSIR